MIGVGGDTVDVVGVVDAVDSIVAKYREGSADATVPKVQMWRAIDQVALNSPLLFIYSLQLMEVSF
ncbi:hypothetical protein [Peribacillus asahii]|uniref:hypothetical protein n=1 Tax=Peribacillus asahii TaxID=228899 RepID=UPI0038012432